MRWFRTEARFLIAPRDRQWPFQRAGPVTRNIRGQNGWNNLSARGVQSGRLAAAARPHRPDSSGGIPNGNGAKAGINVATGIVRGRRARTGMLMAAGPIVFFSAYTGFLGYQEARVKDICAGLRTTIP